MRLRRGRITEEASMANPRTNGYNQPVTRVSTAPDGDTSRTTR